MPSKHPNQSHRVCAATIMDNIADPDITFDEQGICNYFYEYKEMSKKRLFNEEPDKPIDSLVQKIKASGTGSGGEYDCLIGVSGGVDSTYVAYLVKELGLKPLAIHFDNGWNSELAVKNIENVLSKLDIDLFTYVIDWQEFKSLQLAFLQASTPDGEIPTDHAIFALLFNVAAEKKIKYIINGNNFATEFILPKTWSYGHIDWGYIRKINRRFGTHKLKSYPRLTLLKYFVFTFIKGVRIISILNYVPYKKDEAMKILQTKLDWKYYGGKHYESIYTRFFQGYILPEKFKIDKRKSHLSSLICSGQITREMALAEMKKPIYPPGLLEEDRAFVIKKFEIDEKKFDEIMRRPCKTYRDYPNQSFIMNFLRRILNKLRQMGVVYS